jgi:hypothetical protein
VEFYSSSVSKKLKGEEEMGRRRFSGGSKASMTALRFGSSRVEEGGSRLRMTRWRGQMSYPVPRKRERSLHTCAQDVQITRMATI